MTEQVYCDVCGKQIGLTENAYLWEGVMCAKCFKVEFDKEFTLCEKAELAGISVQTPEEMYCV